MDNVFVGKIVNTHGIKGEIRIKSDFELKNRVFVVGKYLIINRQKFEILSYRVHKGYDMVTLKGITSLNDAILLKGLNVYFNKSDLELDSGEYILEDLIGSDCIIDNTIMGTVSDYTYGVNSLLIVNYNNHTYYIPINGNFIDHVDIDENKIYLKSNAKELIL
jgi:16S rRNA processing protein RimM